MFPWILVSMETRKLPCEITAFDRECLQNKCPEAREKGSAMIQNGIKEAEEKILSILQDDDEPTDPTALIGVLRMQGANEAVVREAIWRLIGQKQVMLTSSRQLELAKELQPAG